MLRSPLFTLTALAVLVGADALGLLAVLGKSAPGALGPWMGQWGMGEWGMAHLIISVLGAAVGAAALPLVTGMTRATLAVFFLILAAGLPVVGLLMVGALALILRRPSLGGLRPEERFVFGNPQATAARRESLAQPPNLTPLADGIHEMEEETLCRALLGLKNLQPPGAVMPFLQRYQQDPRTAVQFTAQAVLSLATDRLEDTIRSLRERLAHDSEPVETRLALADSLIQLSTWTTPGDATANIRRREAMQLLQSLPAAHPRVQRLQAALTQHQPASAAEIR